MHYERRVDDVIAEARGFTDATAMHAYFNEHGYPHERRIGTRNAQALTDPEPQGEELSDGDLAAVFAMLKLRADG